MKRGTKSEGAPPSARIGRSGWAGPGLICAAQVLGARGRCAESGSAFQDALRLQRESSKRHGALGSLAGLAQVAPLVEGERLQGQAPAEAILAYLQSHGLDGVDEPLSIHLD